jgi:hypothetical protein
MYLNTPQIGYKVAWKKLETKNDKLHLLKLSQRNKNQQVILFFN